MIIDCISDLHGHYPKLEGGDLLIVAGDLTCRDEADEYVCQFQHWLDAQDYRRKVVIAGNHDGLLEKGIPVYTDFTDKGKPIGQRILLPIHSCAYLCDSGTEMTCYPHLNPPNLDNIGVPYKRKTLKIWGSPWTLTFDGINPHCAAFTGTESELKTKFALIPSDVDILITHGPPIGFMDEVKRYDTGKIENCGSESLYLRLYKQEIRPKLHVFGHIHEGYGHIPKILDMPGVQMVNCSHVNEHYKPVNKPIRVML